LIFQLSSNSITIEFKTNVGKGKVIQTYRKGRNINDPKRGLRRNIELICYNRKRLLNTYMRTPFIYLILIGYLIMFGES